MPKQVPYVHFHTSKEGYEIWSDRTSQKVVMVHQLIAISNGADPYKIFKNANYDCHHKNGIRWDNRPENIEFISRKEHAAIHYERGDFKAPRGSKHVLKEPVLEDMVLERNMSISEIAEELDCTEKSVRRKVRQYNLGWDQRWKR